MPYDVPAEKKPFPQIDNFHFYQAGYVERFWRILVWVSQVFHKFSGRFYGKTSPVQLYWHHMDITVTRFSGRKAPPLPGEAKLLTRMLTHMKSSVLVFGPAMKKCVPLLFILIPIHLLKDWISRHLSLQQQNGKIIMAAPWHY